MKGLRRPLWAVLFSLLAALAFLGAGQLLGLLPLAESPWGGPAAELVLAALALLGLLALGKGRVLTAGGRGFAEGLLAGGFMTVYLCLAMLGALLLWDREPIGELEVLRLALYMFAVGLAEELTFRGLIQNVLADAFGRDSRAGVWRTVAVSGLIFGLVHLGNVLAGAALPGVVMQAAAAAAIGMYLGAVYARCGNIWALAALHGFNDLVGMLLSGAQGMDSAVEAVSAYGPEKLAAVGLYLALTAFILRRKKLEPLLAPAG